jgi:hypothetical protein
LTQGKDVMRNLMEIREGLEYGLKVATSDGNKEVSASLVELLDALAQATKTPDVSRVSHRACSDMCGQSVDGTGHLSGTVRA